MISETDFLMIWNSVEKKELDETLKELSEFCKTNTPEPSLLRRRYKSALANYRSLLDENNCRLPEPLFIYDEKNKKTWPFLDAVITDDKRFIRMIKNPEFAYKDVLRSVNFAF